MPPMSMTRLPERQLSYATISHEKAFGFRLLRHDQITVRQRPDMPTKNPGELRGFSLSAFRRTGRSRRGIGMREQGGFPVPVNRSEVVLARRQFHFQIVGLLRDRGQQRAQLGRFDAGGQFGGEVQAVAGDHPAADLVGGVLLKQ